MFSYSLMIFQIYSFRFLYSFKLKRKPFSWVKLSCLPHEKKILKSPQQCLQCPKHLNASKVSQQYVLNSYHCICKLLLVSQIKNKRHEQLSSTLLPVQFLAYLFVTDQGHFYFVCRSARDDSLSVPLYATGFRTVITS